MSARGSGGGDAARLKEAKDAGDEGEKHLRTSMLKWKPDYMAAEPAFQKAARAYKSVGLLDSAVAAWRRAAECSLKLGNLKQAVVTLENTARELSYATSGSAGNSSKELASTLLSEAAGLLYEAGEAPRAAELKLRAGKLLEGFNNDVAARLYDEAGAFLEGDDDKDVYAKEALTKVLAHQLALGKHASAMRTMDKLAAIYIRLAQPHNLAKLILARVVLLLAGTDAVAAQREYDRNVDAPGFATAPEAAAAEDLLAAYAELNAEALKAVVDRNLFNYLDHAVTRLARGLPAALLSGQAIGSAHAGESASRGVAHTATAADPAAAAGLPPGWKAYGSGLGGGYGSAAAAGASAAASGGATRAADAAAATASSKDASVRSALFSKPAGAAAAGAGGGRVGEDDEQASRYGGRITGCAAAAAPPPPPAAEEEGEGGDYDYEKAFAALGGDGGGDEEDNAHHHTASAAAAPAAPAAAGGEDDLGIM